MGVFGADFGSEMTKKIWVHKTTSFAAAARFDRSYYSRMKRSERLETVQLLREIYFKLHPELKNESRKGLRRAIRVIQQV